MSLTIVWLLCMMTGFEPYRAAARAGVIDAGGSPILIEDFPSLDASSRTACLDLVRSSDVYLVIIGNRPGSAPLGKPVVEEEFDEARRRKLPRLLFIHDTKRDSSTGELVDRLSDYVHGRFGSTFRTPDDLRSSIAVALQDVFGDNAMHIAKNSSDAVETLLTKRKDAQSPVLRLVFIPERKDEVFDVLKFDKPDFRRSIFEIAHRDDVRLFDFEQGEKSAVVKDRDFLVTQEPARGKDKSIGVTIGIREDGAIQIDQTISDRRRNRHGFGFDHQIAESDIEGSIQSAVAFVNALYERIDPGHRFGTFFVGGAVGGMSVHIVVREVREQHSWSLPMDDRDWFVIDKPRKIDRTDLMKPTEVVERLLTFIKKRFGEKR